MRALNCANTVFTHFLKELFQMPSSLTDSRIKVMFDYTISINYYVIFVVSDIFSFWRKNRLIPNFVFFSLHDIYCCEGNAFTNAVKGFVCWLSRFLCYWGFTVFSYSPPFATVFEKMSMFTWLSCQKMFISPTDELLQQLSHHLLFKIHNENVFFVL